MDDEAGSIQNQVAIMEVLLAETDLCDCKDPAVFGDPHFKTWAGEFYDFHGVCDLVLIKNPEFKNGLGMHIHLRTTRTRMWSYVSSAAIRIGEDILEVIGGPEEKKLLPEALKLIEPATLGAPGISARKVSPHEQ